MLWPHRTHCGVSSVLGPSPQPLSVCSPDNPEGKDLLTCLLGKRIFSFLRKVRIRFRSCEAWRATWSDGLAPKGFVQRVRRVQESFPCQ